MIQTWDNHADIKISNSLKDNDSCNLSTCDCAYYGWDQEKHHAMHALARHGVAGKKLRIQHTVKFEVTDWTIIDEGKLTEALAAIAGPGQTGGQH